MRPVDDENDDAESGPDNPLDAAYADVPAQSSEEGVASYYSDSLAGNPTASGEPYDPEDYTCANRVLPLGTVVRITRVDHPELSVHVMVNDRGPFGRRRRIVDLSRAAAEKIHLIADGIAEVKLEVLALGSGPVGSNRLRRHRRHRRR